MSRRLRHAREVGDEILDDPVASLVEAEQQKHADRTPVLVTVDVTDPNIVELLADLLWNWEGNDDAAAKALQAFAVIDSRAHGGRPVSRYTSA